MIQIAICDDEVYVTTEIEDMTRNMCESYNVESEIDVWISFYCSSLQCFCS